MKFSVVVAIVADSIEEATIEVAKKAGATGVTILDGKGRGLKEKKIFFGLTYEEKESILIFVLPNSISTLVLKSIQENLNLTQAHGLAFSLPIASLAGIDKEQLHTFENELKPLL
jgi:nitrogen regulatory protein PII